MSRFSGKCDFYDHVYMTSDPNKTELDLFNEFKAKTGGVIYQSVKIKLTRYNVEKEAESNQFLKIIYPEKKGGRKKYEYFWKVYSSLDALNNHGYYKEIEIHFDTMLDLVKYYPYLVGCCASSKDHMHVEINTESYVDSEYKEMLSFGCESSMKQIYDRELAQEYYRIGRLYDKTLGFDDADSAKLWYILNYGGDAK